MIVGKQPVQDSPALMGLAFSLLFQFPYMSVSSSPRAVASAGESVPSFLVRRVLLSTRIWSTQTSEAWPATVTLSRVRQLGRSVEVRGQTTTVVKLSFRLFRLTITQGLVLLGSLPSTGSNRAQKTSCRFISWKQVWI